MLRMLSMEKKSEVLEVFDRRTHCTALHAVLLRSIQLEYGG